MGGFYFYKARKQGRLSQGARGDGVVALGRRKGSVMGPGMRRYCGAGKLVPDSGQLSCRCVHPETFHPPVCLGVVTFCREAVLQ